MRKKPEFLFPFMRVHGTIKNGYYTCVKWSEESSEIHANIQLARFDRV